MNAHIVGFLRGICLVGLGAALTAHAQSGATASPEGLLRGTRYEENDPERMRQLMAYSSTLYRSKDLVGARAALIAALAIQTAHGARTDPTSVNLVGPLAVIERELGNARAADQYCSELKALEPRSPQVPPQFFQAVKAACANAALPVQVIMGGALGEWARAKSIRAALGIETSSSSSTKALVSRASMWTNLMLGAQAPVKVSPSWELPLERSEADTVAIFAASKHGAKGGSGAFAPAGAKRTVILEDSFLDQPQHVPPNLVSGFGLDLEKLHIVIAVLLHELGHAISDDQSTYATASCNQRKAMETKADEFAARTIRAAVLGERGVVAQAAAGKTLISLIGLGWTFSSTRSLRELVPESMKDDPEGLARAYCEEGASRPAMELRLLRMYRVMLGPEYQSMFSRDDLAWAAKLLEVRQQDLPSCNCLN